MADVAPYPTAAGVEAAIKDSAKKAAAGDPSLNVNERIRLEHFNRFLSRVFSEGAESEWLLKGGTGMLARVPSARTTLDIDLYRDGFTLDQALADLQRLARTDLGDHFRFEYAGHEKSIGGEEQPYTEGYVVTFEVLIGARSRGTIIVDLAVGAGLTAPVTTADPAKTSPQGTPARRQPARPLGGGMPRQPRGALRRPRLQIPGLGSPPAAGAMSARHGAQFDACEVRWTTGTSEMPSDL